LHFTRLSRIFLSVLNEMKYHCNCTFVRLPTIEVIYRIFVGRSLERHCVWVQEYESGRVEAVCWWIQVMPAVAVHDAFLYQHLMYSVCCVFTVCDDCLCV